MRGAADRPARQSLFIQVTAKLRCDLWQKWGKWANWTRDPGLFRQKIAYRIGQSNNGDGFGLGITDLVLVPNATCGTNNALEPHDNALQPCLSASLC